MRMSPPNPQPPPNSPQSCWRDALSLIKTEDLYSTGPWHLSKVCHCDKWWERTLGRSTCEVWVDSDTKCRFLYAILARSHSIIEWWRVLPYRHVKDKLLQVLAPTWTFLKRWNPCCGRHTESSSMPNTVKQVEGPSILLGWMPQPAQFLQHPSSWGWQAGHWDDPKCGSCQGSEWGISCHNYAQHSMTLVKVEKNGTGLPQNVRERLSTMWQWCHSIPERLRCSAWHWNNTLGTLDVKLCHFWSVNPVNGPRFWRWCQPSYNEWKVLLWDAIVHAAGLEYP